MSNYSSKGTKARANQIRTLPSDPTDSCLSSDDFVFRRGRNQIIPHFNPCPSDRNPNRAPGLPDPHAGPVGHSVSHTDAGHPRSHTHPDSDPFSDANSYPYTYAFSNPNTNSNSNPIPYSSTHSYPYTHAISDSQVLSDFHTRSPHPDTSAQ